MLVPYKSLNDFQNLYWDSEEWGFQRVDLKARDLLDAGCFFEAEVLCDDMIYIDCQNQCGELICNQLVSNSCGISDAVASLVEVAHRRFFATV